MRLTASTLVVGSVTALQASFGALFSLFHLTDFALAFSLSSSIIIIVLGYLLVGNYTNFTVVFLIFSFLYGLSGPIAAEYEQGLPAAFPTPYYTDEFLLHYSLAVLGMTFGLIVVACLRPYDTSRYQNVRTYSKTALLSASYLLCLFASLMEMTNFLRVGGLQTLTAGKAVYQSAVSELTGTLPSIEVMFLAAALFGIAFSISKDGSNDSIRIKNILLQVCMWLVFSLPLILSLIVLGRRGPLLALIIMLVVGLFYFQPIRKLRFRWIAVCLLLYVAMAFLYGARWHIAYGLASGDWIMLRERIFTTEFWATSLNPAANEFGAPFGNFNTYVVYGGSDLRWGETYVTGLAMPIPRFIWPNKPESITYEFRDTYFPDWAQLGKIVGTAFSSILEAYINFGTVGVAFVYFVVAFFIGLLEVWRARSGSLGYAIFYLTLLPVAISFHRSSLGMPLFWPLMLTIAGSLVYTSIRSFLRVFGKARWSFEAISRRGRSIDKASLANSE